MSTMIREVYEALKEAGASEEKAAAAAEVLAGITRLDERLGELATKEDLLQLEMGLKERDSILRTELKEDIARLENSTRDEFTKLNEDMGTLRTELKEDMDSLRTEFKEDIARLENSTRDEFTKLKEDMGTLRTEFKEDMDTLRTEVKEDMDSLRTELKEDIAKLETSFKERFQNIDIRLVTVETKLSFMQWMIGATFLGIVALVIRAFWP